MTFRWLIMKGVRTTRTRRGRCVCFIQCLSYLYIIGGVGAEQDHATLLLQQLSSTPFVFSEFFRDTVCMWCGYDL